MNALSPLRIYASESYIRFRDIQIRIVASESNACHLLSMEKNFPSMSEWAKRDGCYFVSTCYFVACMYGYLYRAKEKISYLDLEKDLLGRLITQISNVTIAFSDDGMYYALQLAVGAHRFR